VPLFLQSALGVSVFIGLAWAVSEDRRAFPWRIVVAGLAFQFALAAVLLKLPWVRDWVAGLNEVMQALERATEAGTSHRRRTPAWTPLRAEPSRASHS